MEVVFVTVFVGVRVAMTSMGVTVSVRMCMRSAGIPRDAGGVKYVRQASEQDMIPFRRSLPCGEGNDKKAAEMQSNVLMAAQSCGQRKENKSRR